MLAAPALAQSGPDLIGSEAGYVVLSGPSEGHILIERGGAALDCRYERTEAFSLVSACRPVLGFDASAADVTDVFENSVRQVFRNGARCAVTPDALRAETWERSEARLGPIAQQAGLAISGHVIEGLAAEGTLRFNSNTGTFAHTRLCQ
ncbi:MAG: hypothetical protein AAFQ36_03140 [Pseudomonadota bacterium]